MNTQVMSALNQNAELMRRARFLNMSFGIVSGNARHLVVVRPGDVTVMATGPGEKEPPFTISASQQAWDEYAREAPRPGFNDVIAMVESGNGKISGSDLLPFFGNLFFVKGVVSALFKGHAAW